jgi:5-methylcytosine-specific restriction protein A
MAMMAAAMLKRFSAVEGAYSVVTYTEAGHDRAVTVDRHEKKPISRLYPLTSFTMMGGSVPDGKPERFPFIVHDRTSPAKASLQDLAIKYPKQEKNELRLYMSHAAAFDAQAGDIFYVFYKAGDKAPHVGFMPPELWDGQQPVTDDGFDEDDERYQQSVFAAIAKQPVASTIFRYPRNPAAAAQALQDAEFTCEADPSHGTFTSDATQQPYVEAHHLMPLSNPLGLAGNLDVPENIVALCPNCHRRVHLEEKVARITMLADLYSKRKLRLKAHNLDFGFPELLRAYGLV